jgi:hypothetical protein
MVTIRLKGKLTDDRRLLVEIPDNIPSGDVELILEIPNTSANEATERARAKLADAGALSTIWKAPPGTSWPSEDELLELGAISPGAPSVADLVNDDRGER